MTNKHDKEVRAYDLLPGELRGIQHIPDDAQSIYSVGVGAAGLPEIYAIQGTNRHIVATTVSVKGAAVVRQSVAASGYSDQITVKLEDVTEPLPYEDNSFDCVYARLVLHYLSRQQLPKALESLHRILRPGGTFYVVVRSQGCPDFLSPSAQYDEETGMTSFTAKGPAAGETHTAQRFFHTTATITDYITRAGFEITGVKQYKERLFADFDRMLLADEVEDLIEVLAHKR